MHPIKELEKGGRQEKRKLSKQGKVVAITGGANGIGYALARRWTVAGGKAVLLDRNTDAIAAATKSVSAEQMRGIECDVSSQASVDRAFSSIAEIEGRLDALSNGAGIILPANSSEATDEDFGHVVDVHVFGANRACRAAFSLLKKSRGAIVNISSVAAFVGMPKRASYCTAKAAIEGLTRTLAVEWAPEGIRVNSLAPGYTKTYMTEHLIVVGKIDVGKIEARTPLRRFAEPDEMAAPIDFLLSDDASYITGHCLVVDGGMTIDGNWY
jgi:NAD(P)-dependent dehydrogenase (short-subunit alcohol dehydrogenase family)